MPAESLSQGSFRRLIRAAGVAAVVSGLLNIVYFATHPSGGEPPAAHAVNGWYAPLHGLEILGQLSFLLAVTGMYLVQSRAAGGSVSPVTFCCSSVPFL